MAVRGRIWTDVGCALLLVLLGCRSTTPELKPPPQPEVLNKPPDETRYNSPAYPKQALIKDDDPTKKFGMSGSPPPMNMPRGGMGGPGGAGGGPGMGGFGR